MRVAFIGTRGLQLVPPDGLTLFDTTVDWVVARGGIVRTGAAPGGDQRAADRALAQRGRVELILPWHGYEASWVEHVVGRHPDLVTTVTFDPERHPEWLASVDRYHPIGPKLTHNVRRLHARNYGIVVEARAVVAVPRLPESGGTAQGLRIARDLGIPSFNISQLAPREAVRAWMRAQEAAAS